MRPGKRIECELTKPGDFGQRPLEIVIHSQSPLACVYGLGGMYGGELLARRQFLVDVRVVLHRATAQRIETIVNTKVVSAHVRVMTHNSKLVTLWQLSVSLTPHGLWQFIITIHVFRQRISLAPLVGKLKYQLAV